MLTFIGVFVIVCLLAFVAISTVFLKTKEPKEIVDKKTSPVSEELRQLEEEIQKREKKERELHLRAAGIEILLDRGNFLWIFLLLFLIVAGSTILFFFEQLVKMDWYLSYVVFLVEYFEKDYVNSIIWLSIFYFGTTFIKWVVGDTIGEKTHGYKHAKWINRIFLVAFLGSLVFGLKSEIYDFSKPKEEDLALVAMPKEITVNLYRLLIGERVTTDIEIMSVVKIFFPNPSMYRGKMIVICAELIEPEWLLRNSSVPKYFFELERGTSNKVKIHPNMRKFMLENEMTKVRAKFFTFTIGEEALPTRDDCPQIDYHLN